MLKCAPNALMSRGGLPSALATWQAPRNFIVAGCRYDEESPLPPHDENSPGIRSRTCTRAPFAGREGASPCSSRVEEAGWNRKTIPAKLNDKSVNRFAVRRLVPVVKLFEISRGRARAGSARVPFAKESFPLLFLDPLSSSRRADYW